jgi:2'-5' RNA ligase
MDRAPSGSAIFIPVRVPPAVERLRRRYDPSAELGVPAHITLLYPFAPPDDLMPEMRAVLAGVVSRQAPFEVSFGRVRRFPGVVWLAPRPAAPVVRLTHALAEAFPEQRPYGGAFDSVIPHLTIAQSREASVLRAVETALAVHLPIKAMATSVTVAATRPDGRWHTRWRLSLGAAVAAG